MLEYVNCIAGDARSAVLTVPGLGCGLFAGPFHGKLGSELRDVLIRLLEDFGDTLPNLKAVYFDPYDECINSRFEINGISLLVRPLTQPGNARRSQLCTPVTYQDAGDDFHHCSLFSIVAWDHVSWPGNDFFAGSRATDDGVKAAATNSMSALTGVDGAYDVERGTYQPPLGFPVWETVVQEERRCRGLRLWKEEALWRRSPRASA